jgi:hypothetical protein
MHVKKKSSIELRSRLMSPEAIDWHSASGELSSIKSFMGILASKVSLLVWIAALMAVRGDRLARPCELASTTDN